MDCPPGTPFGITAQKRTESGILEVFTGSNEAYSNGTKRPFTDLHTFGQTEETGAPYGLISIFDICPSYDPAEANELLSYRPENME